MYDPFNKNECCQFLTAKDIPKPSRKDKDQFTISSDITMLQAVVTAFCKPAFNVVQTVTSQMPKGHW